MNLPSPRHLDYHKLGSRPNPLHLDLIVSSGGARIFEMRGQITNKYLILYIIHTCVIYRN
jgi:hypothetical protein